MKRSWLTWLLIIAMSMVAFAVVGCSDDDDEAAVPYDVTRAVATAGDSYFDDYKIVFNSVAMGVNVPANTAFQNITLDPDHYYIVDMRAAADYAHMHLDGAVNVSMGGLVDAIDTFPTDRIILVVCYSGQTASYATSIINLIGTESGHVAQNLKFGASGILELEDVKADGTYVYPQLNEQLAAMVTTDSPAKNAAGSYPAIEADVSDALGALKARARVAAQAWIDGTCKTDNNTAADASTDALYLINYFSEPNYLDGHLPTALQYSPPSTGVDGAFTTGMDLSTLPTDKPVAVYCYTGQTSAQVAAYLQMMGYQGQTVIYGIQKMAADDEDINDVPWHGPEDDYSSIMAGTGMSSFDVTAAVSAAGDDYFDDYKIVFNSVTMGVNVPANTVFQNIALDPDHYYVVDMRSSTDYDHMHIEGAVNVSMGGLVDAIPAMPTNKIILVMCYSGQTASYATSIINLLGTESGHVAQNLKFGASGILELADVKADGTYVYPQLNENILDMVTTPSPAKNAPGAYPTLSDDGISTTLEALQARARVAAAAWGDNSCKTDNNTVASASPSEMYVINYFTPTNYLDGHLQHSLQYSPPSTGVDGAFTTGMDLNTLPTDRPVAVYCYTGQTSAQVAAYLQMMGYQGQTVIYGIQKMAADDTAINDVPWHGPDDDYSSIFTGTPNTM